MVWVNWGEMRRLLWRKQFSMRLLERYSLLDIMAYDLDEG